MARILIIEDEDKLRKGLQQILKFSDFEVVAASNGEEGFALIKDFIPDLILCDIMMPGMSGYDVLTKLQNYEDEYASTIPLVFITAKSDLAEIRAGMDLGADDYLTKPIKTESLLNCINSRLKKQEVLRQRSQAQLDQLRKNISRTMPHELNTPLNGIMGCAQLLQTIPDEEVQELSVDILKSAERLHSTISQFLVYTELELARQAPQASSFIQNAYEVNVSGIIEKITQKKAAKVERQSDVRLNLEPGILVTSSFFCMKLLEELIDNAFKFSKPGSEVIVSTEWMEEQLIVTIQDHGYGMKAEQIAQIGAYTQFERRIYEQQGSGLGLIIAKYITELQGGTLKIDSQPGDGTTIQVSLPLKPSPTIGNK